MVDSSPYHNATINAERGSNQNDNSSNTAVTATNNSSTQTYTATGLSLDTIRGTGPNSTTSSKNLGNRTKSYVSNTTSSTLSTSSVSYYGSNEQESSNGTSTTVIQRTKPDITSKGNSDTSTKLNVPDAFRYREHIPDKVENAEYGISPQAKDKTGKVESIHGEDWEDLESDQVELEERSKRAYEGYETYYSSDNYQSDDAGSNPDDDEYDWLNDYLNEDRMQDDFSPPSKSSKMNKSRYKGSGSNSLRPRSRGRGRKSSNEYTIKRLLLRDYDTTSRPVMNDSTTVTVSVGMSLFHILDTNEKMQTLSALIAIRLRWMDEYLVWDPDQYGGVDTIWIPAMQIWTPDIFINNFADESFQDFMNTYAIIQSTGEVLWMFPAVIKTYCTLDVRHFPFDRQKCDIVFISWTFNGFKVNITYNESEHSAVYYKPKNQEWFVDEVGATRKEKIYACCIEPYPDVSFTIYMTRRSLFYIINLIFPCLLIYTVSFLGFYLPVESGEKVNLEITILLALVVFLLMVGETLPPTPDAIPALGLLFGTTMLMVSIALVMAVIVTNLYLRKDSGDRVPYCVRKVFLPRDTNRNMHLHSCTNPRRFSSAHENNHHIGENHCHNMKSSSCYNNQNEGEVDNVSMYSEQETTFCLRGSCRRNRYKPRLPYQISDPEQTLWSLEWQLLAKVVDRICFWLFLFSSITALSTIFASIPQHDITI